MHISWNGIGEEEEEEEGFFLFVRIEEREVLDLGRYREFIGSSTRYIQLSSLSTLPPSNKNKPKKTTCT